MTVSRGYEKGLTLPSVPPSGQHSKGVNSVWGMESHHNVVQKQVSTRDYNYRQATEDMNTRVDATRGMPPPTVMPTTMPTII